MNSQKLSIRIKVYDKMTGLFFCPNCHRRINAPFDGNIKVTGAINLRCRCKKGLIIIKPKNHG